MNDKLYEQLEQWDGKYSDQLISIYKEHKNDKTFFKDLVDISEGKNSFRPPCLWMMKRYGAEKKIISSDEGAQFSGLLPKLDDWVSILLALQLLPHIMIDKKVYKRIEAFVNKNTDSKNNFIRAWVYQGLYELSKNDPSKLAALKKKLLKLITKESASVKARIRKILSVYHS